MLYASGIAGVRIYRKIRWRISRGIVRIDGVDVFVLAGVADCVGSTDILVDGAAYDRLWLDVG